MGGLGLQFTLLVCCAFLKHTGAFAVNIRDVVELVGQCWTFIFKRYSFSLKMVGKQSNSNILFISMEFFSVWCLHLLSRLFLEAEVLIENGQKRRSNAGLVVG